MAMKRGGGRGRPRTGPKINTSDILGPIDYKDVEVISRFLGPQGQMLSRRRTGYAAQRQREVKKAIKRARHMALIPFVG